MVPDHSPVTSLGSHFACCSAVPCAIKASIAAGVSMLTSEKPILALPRSSITTLNNAKGRPCPPKSSGPRSEEHTSELQSLMRISYAVFCLKKKKTKKKHIRISQTNKYKRIH